MYDWMKWVHVLGMVIYVGGVLTLTRLLGHAVRFESATSRKDAYRVLKRMHVFVDWGGLFLMILGGVWLLVADPMGKLYMKQGYFHLKLTCAIVLILGDIFLSRKLFRLQADGPQPKATFFKIMHGIVGLALLGALAAVFIVRG